MQFRIGENSDFHQTPHIYVFSRADYEYNSENCRLVNFHGKTRKIMVVYVCLNQYTKFHKMSIQLVDLIEIHICCYMHFFLRLIVSEKITDTFDIKFKYLKVIQATRHACLFDSI